MTMTVKSLLFAAFVAASTVLWHAVAHRNVLRSRIARANNDRAVARDMDLPLLSRRSLVNTGGGSDSCGKGGKGGKGGSLSRRRRGRKLCDNGDSGEYGAEDPLTDGGSGPDNGGEEPVASGEGPGDGQSGPVDGGEDPNDGDGTDGAVDNPSNGSDGGGPGNGADGGDSNGPVPSNEEPDPEEVPPSNDIGDEEGDAEGGELDGTPLGTGGEVPDVEIVVQTPGVTLTLDENFDDLGGVTPPAPSTASASLSTGPVPSNDD